MDSIVQVFLERLESESEEHRDLVPFFKIIFTYFYVFPVSEHSRFVDRKSFTRALSNETDFPKLAFILELFGLKEALSIIEYLNKYVVVGEY